MATPQSGNGKPVPATSSSGAQLRSPFGKIREGEGARISLKDVDPQILVEALDNAIGYGVLVAIGRTSDGGAIGFYITDNGHKEKAWAGNETELEMILTSLRTTYS